MHADLRPIDVGPLVPGERAALLELLCDLRADEWRAPTVCAGWTVHDIALHLLGDDVGFVSRWRDGHPNPHFADGLDITSWDGLVGAIDRQNAEWVRAARRISPPLLVELLRLSGERFSALVAELDPHAPADPVDWAGPGPAPVWLHIAREYTERWVHQQQIRDAVARPGLTGREWLHPVLSAFALAVPRALDAVTAAGTSVRLVIDGDAGGSWRYLRRGERWAMADDPGDPTDAQIHLDADTAWRLFTKGVTPTQAASAAQLSGDPTLTAAVLRTVAILA